MADEQEEKSRIRFEFDWGTNICFWSGNKKALEEFGTTLIAPERLSLPPELVKRAYELEEWRFNRLNWQPEYDPSLWFEEECIRFNQSSRAFFEEVKATVGDQYELVYDEIEHHEEPYLRDYLKNILSFATIEIGHVQGCIELLQRNFEEDPKFFERKPDLLPAYLRFILYYLKFKDQFQHPFDFKRSVELLQSLFPNTNTALVDNSPSSLETYIKFLLTDELHEDVEPPKLK